MVEGDHLARCQALGPRGPSDAPSNAPAPWVEGVRRRTARGWRAGFGPRGHSRASPCWRRASYRPRPGCVRAECAEATLASRRVPTPVAAEAAPATRVQEHNSQGHRTVAVALLRPYVQLESIRKITDDPWHTTRADNVHADCRALNWVKPDGRRKLLTCPIAPKRMAAHGVIWLSPPTRAVAGTKPLASPPPPAPGADHRLPRQPRGPAPPVGDGARRGGCERTQGALPLPRRQTHGGRAGPPPGA